MAINQENLAIAKAIGIPSLELNKKQRAYYPVHFRNCVNLLKWSVIINVILLVLLLYLFFTRPHEHYFISSFDGKIMPITNTSLAQAKIITQQNYVQENPV